MICMHGIQFPSEIYMLVTFGVKWHCVNWQIAAYLNGGKFKLMDTSNSHVDNTAIFSVKYFYILLLALDLFSNCLSKFSY